MLAPNPSNVNPAGYETVTFTRKRRTVKVPKYRMLSLHGAYMSDDYQEAIGVDFLTTLLSVSATAQKSFALLHTQYDDDTGVSIISSFANQSEQNGFSRGFKELHKVGLVKRIKRQHYLLNPRMYINPNVYESACLLWDSLV